MFKFIFLTILAYIIFRWLDRMFRGPKTPSQNPPRKRNTSKKQDLSSTKNAKSVIKDDVGEYVDYEELDDKD